MLQHPAKLCVSLVSNPWYDWYRWLQDIAAESFVTKPILFGDYLKMGQEKQDRLYEELADYKKLENVLQDVSCPFLVFSSLSCSLS